MEQNKLSCVLCDPIDDSTNQTLQNVLRVVRILQFLKNECPDSKELIVEKGQLLIQLTTQGSHFHFEGKTPEDMLALLAALHEPYPSTD
jgi:hypothetical protein